MKRYFTSESVTEGHPDKLCDQISDAVLDAYLAVDPYARVACETAATTGLVLVMGEITANGTVDIARIARDTILDIGYTRGKYGFDGERCAVMVTMNRQSPDIAMGVDAALENRASGASDTGAGDQGMMFGFACNETPERMPLPVSLAHKLSRQLAVARKSGALPWLRPDGKTQVTVEYDGNRPVRVDTIVVSTQHDPLMSQERIREEVEASIIRPVVGEWVDADTRLLVNPTGRFVIGGPMGDSGLTGRKIIVDTYGGYARHGGGAFSGKDPTKVDRSAAYAARYVTRNLVAAGIAERCELEIAYAIGVARPVSVMVDTFGTGVVDDARITDIVTRAFDLRPAAIIEELQLRRPIYRQTAAYGHFGRNDLDVPWEREDRAALLKGLV